MPTSNKYSYLTKEGLVKGYFNIYQSKKGAIILVLGDRYIELSKEQISHLCLDAYPLIDFDIDTYIEHYK